MPVEKGVFFQVYPNPFRDFVSITAGASLNQPSTIKVFNTYGDISFEADLNQQSQTFTVDLRDAPSGTYYCVFQSGKVQTTIKMVKL